MGARSKGSEPTLLALPGANEGATGESVETAAQQPNPLEGSGPRFTMTSSEHSLVTPPRAREPSHSLESW